MKVLVIDTDKKSPRIEETPGGLEEWQKLVNCRLIAISYYKINGKAYDIISDDEALLKAGGKVTAIDRERGPLLVGNLVICNYDGEGGEAGLSEDDISHIWENIVILEEAHPEDPKKPKKWLAIANVEP